MSSVASAVLQELGNDIHEVFVLKGVIRSPS